MEPQIFALKSTEAWGRRTAQRLEIKLSSHEERNFEDGEHKIRPLENVRCRDVYVIQSLYEDPVESVNDKLCRLLFFIGALKDASARQVTAVIPYFAYARKDRKTKARDPITMKYMAQLLEAAGADHIISMDVHNLAAYQNSFRIPTEHLEARALFAPYFAALSETEEVIIISPDAGGVKRAEKFRQTLTELTQKKTGIAFLEKTRSEGITKGGEVIVGNVKGKTAIIFDDIISSGKTIRLAVDALEKADARRIFACATHGLFIGEACELLTHPRLEKILITNSIAPFRLKEDFLKEKIEILDCTALFAKAIKRSQAGDSLVDLMENYSKSIQDSTSLNRGISGPLL
jgi:ribose-phosphate pyrophosphokinase